MVHPCLFLQNRWRTDASKEECASGWRFAALEAPLETQQYWPSLTGCDEHSGYPKGTASLGVSRTSNPQEGFRHRTEIREMAERVAFRSRKPLKRQGAKGPIFGIDHLWGHFSLMMAPHVTFPPSRPLLPSENWENCSSPLCNKPFGFSSLFTLAVLRTSSPLSQYEPLVLAPVHQVERHGIYHPTRILLRVKLDEANNYPILTDIKTRFSQANKNIWLPNIKTLLSPSYKNPI